MNHAYKISEIILVAEQRCLISEDYVAFFFFSFYRKVNLSKIILTLSKYSCRYQIRGVLRIILGIYYAVSSVFPVPP